MPSETAPRRNAANTKEMRRGWRESAGSTRNISARETAGAHPTDTYRRYHWDRNDAGNRPAPQATIKRGPGPSQRRNGGVGQNREHREDSHREQRRANSPDWSMGPRRGHQTVSSLKSMRENEADSGMGPRGGTGRPPGSAPWPENIRNGRQPVWAVPGKEWLDLQPSTVEPMELGPQEEVEEEMQVDPPPPEHTWDCRSMSLLSSIHEHQHQRRSARPAPYSLLRRHPKR